MGIELRNLKSHGDSNFGDKHPRLSICMPIFGRPERTKRMLWNIIAQDMNGWELWAIGDGCPHFAGLIQSGFMDMIGNIAAGNGNKVVFGNFATNNGGYGATCRNFAHHNATAPFMIYCDNDDVILPNHFRNYLNRIEFTSYDLVYFNTFVYAKNVVRDTRLEFGHIGNQEIIIRLSKFRELVLNEGDRYGHDYDKIMQMVNGGCSFTKAQYAPITHHIMSLPSKREEGID